MLIVTVRERHFRLKNGDAHAVSAVPNNSPCPAAYSFPAVVHIDSNYDKGLA